MQRTILTVLSLTAALAAQTTDYWRGVLQSPGGELPFQMSGLGPPTHLRHGAEVVRLSAPLVAGQRLRLPPYDAWIDAEAVPGRHGHLMGNWTKVRGSGEMTMPFRMAPWGLELDAADNGRGYLAPTFPLEGAPLDVTGRWRVKFDGDPHHAVAIFAANRERHVGAPGEIVGTFLTVTGDYRYLAGTARGDQLRLSVFDGAHAFLFHASRQTDGSLVGEFWSGSNWHEKWTAVRDDEAALPDAFSLTKVNPDVELAELSYPEITSDAATPRRLGDLFGKCTLVVLFGTWCPNCGDSGAYLEQLLEHNRERGLRVVGLAFEHGDDRQRHLRVVRAYRERHGADWPILLAGPSDKQRAGKAFAAIDAVRSFPTTLFVDAAGKVRAVHQGFAGPATGSAHAAQCASFERLVDRLIDEAGGY